MKKQYFTLFIREDVEPELYGPYATEEERDNKSIEIRRKEGQDEGGIYWLDLGADGKLEVGPYTGGFLDDADEEEGCITEKAVETKVAADTDAPRFLNHYRCPNCGTKWDDEWSAMCDDDCPQCGTRHVSPYASDDIAIANTEATDAGTVE